MNEKFHDLKSIIYFVCELNQKSSPRFVKTFIKENFSFMKLQKENSSAWEKLSKPTKGERMRSEIVFGNKKLLR